MLQVSPTTSEAHVRSYLASFDRRDPEEIAGHVSDDFVNEHTSGLGSGCLGRAAYRKRLPEFLAEMAGLHYQVEDLITDEDRTAAFYTMTATWQGETAIRIRGVQRLVVKDGLITHRTDYWDSAVFLGQVSEDARSALESFGVTSD